MTLLDKTFYLIKSGLAILLVPFFFACDDPSDLGLDLELQANELKTSKIEIPLSLSTVYIDSLRTNVGSRVILGRFEDEVSGIVLAIPYLSYTSFDGVFPGDSLVYHSVNISMEHTEVRSLPTVMQLDLNVHEVKQDIYANPVYLSNRKLEIEENVLGSLSSSYSPSRDSTFNIPLNDDFGRTLYSRLKNASDTGYIQGFDHLKDKLDSIKLVYLDSIRFDLYPDKPLAIVPTSNSTGLLKLDLSNDSITLNIVMSNLAGTNLYEYNYVLNSNYYTYLERDLSGSIHSDLIEEYKPSSSPSNLSYLDIMSGLYPKLNLDPMFEFGDTIENFLINKAFITIPSTSNSEGFVENIAYITPYIIRGNGRINGSGLVAGNYYNNVVLSNANNLYYSSQEILRLPLDSIEYEGDVTLFSDYSLGLLKAENVKLAEELILMSSDYLDVGRTALKSDEVILTIYYTTTKQ